MVDVNVPLTMNWRGVNISNHKDQWHYRCLPRAMTGGPGHHIFTKPIDLLVYLSNYIGRVEIVNLELSYSTT